MASRLGLIFDEVCRAAEGGDIRAYADALALLPKLAEEHAIAAQAYARVLRDMAAGRAVRAAEDGDGDAAQACAEFFEGSCAMFARDDFDAYTLYMEMGRDPEKRFYQPRRAILYPKVARHLQLLGDGLLDLLAISLPPRVGKSTLCIFFLTWTMGRGPLSANVMSGHSSTLTEGFYKEALDIVSDSSTYRFARVFPEAKLVDNSAKYTTVSLVRKGRFPTLTCRSIEGTLTGAVEVGRDGLLYVDDLVEDREQALSRPRMLKLYAAYLNQLKDRKKEGARELHVATRWCPDDVIGRLASLYAGDPRKRFVAVPALGADGESNFVYERDMGFSTAYYEDMRDSLAAAGESDSWAAKYMGKPEYIGGTMFPADQLRRFGALPDGQPDAVLCACDTKDRGADFCCMPVGYIYGEDCYVVDAVCDDSLPAAFVPRLVDAICRHGVSRARFESNAAGGVICDQVEAACRERGWAGRVTKVYSTSNKETRILADSGWIVERCLFWDRAPNRDYSRMMEQLCGYTTEGKVAHDDGPDALSMLKRLACSMRGATVEAVRRVR